MGVARFEPVAVVDQDGVAGKEKRLGHAHDAIRGGDDGGASRGGYIDAHMRRARLAIEDALAAIDALIGPVPARLSAG